MRKTLLATAAAFAITAVPSVLLAQDPAVDSNPPQGEVAPVPAPDGTTTVTTTQTTATSTPQAAKGTEAGRKVMMTTKQKTTYATWPEQRRTDFEALSSEDQTYYWTLTPVQQEGYWALTPDQRGQIYKMTPEQRATAWQSIEQQLAGQTPTTPAGQANPPGEGMPTQGVPNPQSANQAAQPAMPADESYQGGPYKGAKTPPPADAMGKDYPVCSRTVTDGCRNRGGK
jgi:hypothetical protein